MNNVVPIQQAISTRTIKALAPQTPLRGHLPFGDPEGTSDGIEVTSKWLERGGKPWLPITGEIHYSRLPRERWEEVVAKAAAGGLNSVAMYIIWQVHEPVQGQFGWDGNRDLRAFIELCGRHSLDVIIRMGPWSHGEARNGGFPDWLLELDLDLRSNDPRYLELVRRLYGEIIGQVRGLTHAEGGPIIGVQIENELYNDSQHLATLRVIAEELGLRVPLWTATGWGGAEVPETLFPLYSAYSEGFWEETDVEWPAFAAYHYLYSEVRDDLSVGKDLREALDGIVIDPETVPLKDDSVIPFATCELGGGMHVAYHRRPLVTSDDVSKLALAKVGSGSMWQGYYMYSGGSIRKGPHGTEQESHASGYPNDVPTVTYDFFAPLGEFNQVREHYHQLRRQHLWFQQDGSELSAMRTEIGGGSVDPRELRWAVRSNGERGYLFATTYQPQKRAIEGQKDVQVTIEFASEAVTVPSTPIDLPQGVSVAWPLNFQISAELTLRYATADIFTRINDDEGEIFVLAATDGVRVELAFNGVHEVTGCAVGRVVAGNTIVELTQEPGLNTVITVSEQRILILDEYSSVRTYRLQVGGQERLVRSTAAIYADGKNLIAHPDSPDTVIDMLPAPAQLASSQGELKSTTAGLWSTWTLTVADAGTNRLVENLDVEASIDPQPVFGGPMNRLTAPTDFADSAKLAVEIPRELLEDTDRALLRIQWTGDVGRAAINGEVIADHFWYGRNWDIDLTPYREELCQGSLELQLMPWKASHGIWVDPSVRGIQDGIHIEAIDVIRIPRVVLEFGL